MLWNWLKQKVSEFNTWVASWLPGAKTYLVAAVGTLATMAGALQEYITGIPLGQMVGETKALLITAGLFTLVFWTRFLANRNT